jgi:hypothetical protein
MGGEVIPEAHGEAGGNAEQQMLRSERERFLRAQVERLGKQCATLLRLFIWNNWSLESIANEMGITPQSAKKPKIPLHETITRRHPVETLHATSLQGYMQRLYNIP